MYRETRLGPLQRAELIHRKVWRTDISGAGEVLLKLKHENVTTIIINV